jgi:hypothetical protein
VDIKEAPRVGIDKVMDKVMEEVDEDPPLVLIVVR